MSIPCHHALLEDAEQLGLRGAAGLCVPDVAAAASQPVGAAGGPRSWPAFHGDHGVLWAAHCGRLVCAVRRPPDRYRRAVRAWLDQPASADMERRRVERHGSRHHLAACDGSSERSGSTGAAGDRVCGHVVCGGHDGVPGAGVGAGRRAQAPSRRGRDSVHGGDDQFHRCPGVAESDASLPFRPISRLARRSIQNQCPGHASCCCASMVRRSTSSRRLLRQDVCRTSAVSSTAGRRCIWPRRGRRSRSRCGRRS